MSSFSLRGTNSKIDNNPVISVNQEYILYSKWKKGEKKGALSEERRENREKRNIRGEKSGKIE